MKSSMKKYLYGSSGNSRLYTTSYLSSSGIIDSGLGGSGSAVAAFKILSGGDYFKAIELLSAVATCETKPQFWNFQHQLADFKNFGDFGYCFLDSNFKLPMFMNLASAALHYNKISIFEEIHNLRPKLAFASKVGVEYLVNTSDEKIVLNCNKVKLVNALDVALSQENYGAVKLLVSDDKLIKENLDLITRCAKNANKVYYGLTEDGKPMTRSKKAILELLDGKLQNLTR